MAKLLRTEMRGGRQYLIFDDAQLQEYYDALFALGEPGSPTPFDVNSTADLAKLGIIGTNEKTGEDILSHPLRAEPERTLRKFYIMSDQLFPRNAEAKERIAQLERTDPARWNEEKKTMELFLARKYMARHLKALAEGQLMVMNREAREYPQSLKLKRDASTGRVRAGFEDVPRTEPAEPAPVPPRQPGRWVSFWHKFSRKWLYQDTMAAYQQEKAQYEKALAAYRRRDAWRRTAKKLWPDYAAEGISRDRQRREQERRDWIDRNQENYVRDGSDAEAAVEALRASVREDLNRAFAQAKDEKKSELMMDNITINGRTVKSILCDRFRAGARKDDDIIDFDYNRALLTHLQSIDQGTIEQLVSAALAKRAHVEVFGVDGHRKLQETPEVWTRRTPPATPNGERLMQEKAVQWLPELRSEAKSSMLKRVEETRKLICRRNHIHNASLASDGMQEALLGSWLRQHGVTKQTIPTKVSLSISRTALESHAVAWLVLNTKLTPQEIFDDSKGLKEKAEAGAAVCEHFVKNDKDWLLKLNVEGRIKLGELIDTHIRSKNIDVSDKDMLYSRETSWIFGACHALHDLDQEYGELKGRMKAVYGQDLALRKHDEAADRANAYSWLVDSRKGTLQAISAILGDHQALTAGFSDIGARELETAEGRQLLKASAKRIDRQAAMEIRSVANLAAPDDDFDRFFRAGIRFRNLEDRKQIAKWAYDGGLVKDFKAVCDPDTLLYRAVGKTPAVQNRYASAAGPQKSIPAGPARAAQPAAKASVKQS